MTNALLEQASAANGGAAHSAVDFAAEVTTEGDVRVAWLSGELDLAAAPWLADALAETTSMMRQHLVLDLSNVDFVDAAGLGAIVRARNTLRSRSGELTLRSPSRFTARVLEIAGLASMVSQATPILTHGLGSGKQSN